MSGYGVLVVLVMLVMAPLVQAGQLSFTSAWARATVPAAKTAAVYGVFTNNSDQVWVITGLHTELAGMAMIHRSSLNNGMMKMSSIEALTIAPGKSLVLAPSGLHIMLMGLKSSLTQGGSFELEITAKNGVTTRAQIKVGSIGQMSAVD
ncbi:MAG: copper chaperone PCu(A)C [Pseudomonadales bacterium]